MEALLEENKKKDLFENPRNAFKTKFIERCHEIDKSRLKKRAQRCFPGCDEARSAYQFSKQIFNQFHCQDKTLNQRVKGNRAGCYSLQVTEELIANLIQFHEMIS